MNGALESGWSYFKYFIFYRIINYHLHYISIVVMPIFKTAFSIFYDKESICKKLFMATIVFVKKIMQYKNMSGSPCMFIIIYNLLQR